MTEIWNLSTLCRCCHSDGCFKKLNLPYHSENNVEIYEIMLREVFSITIVQPPMEQASYTICDSCINRLRNASIFREQVLACEQKFQVYCRNELFLHSNLLDSVKAEVESNASENDIGLDADQDIDSGPVDVHILPNDGNLNAVDVKDEVMIEVDISIPIQKYEKDKENIKMECERERYLKKTSTKIGKIYNKKKQDERLKQAVCNRNKLKKRHEILENIKKEKTADGHKYSCKSCEESYRTKKELYQHLHNKHESWCKCEVCGKQFKHEALLKNHMSNHCEKVHSCQHCDKKFRIRANLKIHEKTHTGPDIFQCDICKKELRYKSTLRKHIKLHTGENKAVLCDICGWSFNQRCNLEAHIRAVHLKLRPFACSICGKTYTAKKHVKYHMKSVHSGNTKPYQCDRCSKCFACPKSFKIHRLTHENQFSCRYCPLVFKSKKEIDVHTKNHTEKHLLCSPFSCHFCGKVLMTRFTLNRHLEIHSGIKRFHCDICGMKFTQKMLLQRHHNRKHDPNVKIEKVKCDLCKKFVRDLDKHMDIHDADKRKFFCNLCGKNYPTNNALTRHKNQKHFGVSYDCEICGKKYIKKGSLKTHKLKIHKIKEELDVSNVDMKLTTVVT